MILKTKLNRYLLSNYLVIKIFNKLDFKKNNLKKLK